MRMQACFAIVCVVFIYSDESTWAWTVQGCAGSQRHQQRGRERAWLPVASVWGWSGCQAAAKVKSRWPASVATRALERRSMTHDSG